MFQVKDFSRLSLFCFLSFFFFLQRDVWRLCDSLSNTHTQTCCHTLPHFHPASCTHTHSYVISSVASTIRPCGVVLITPMSITTSAQGALSVCIHTQPIVKGNRQIVMDRFNSSSYTHFRAYYKHFSLILRCYFELSEDL